MSIGFTQYRETQNDRFVCVLQFILFLASPRHSLPLLSFISRRRKHTALESSERFALHNFVASHCVANFECLAHHLHSCSRSRAAFGLPQDLRLFYMHTQFRLRLPPLLALLVSAEQHRFHTFVEREKNVVFHRTRNDRRSCPLRYVSYAEAREGDGTCAHLYQFVCESAPRVEISRSRRAYEKKRETQKWKTEMSEKR